MALSAHNKILILFYKYLTLQVTYQVEGFIDKNNDLLFKDLSRAMYSCEHALLQTLFPEGNQSNQYKYVTGVFIG